MTVSLCPEFTNLYGTETYFRTDSGVQSYDQLNAVAELRGRVDGNSDSYWRDFRSKSVPGSLVS